MMHITNSQYFCRERLHVVAAQRCLSLCVFVHIPSVTFEACDSGIISHVLILRACDNPKLTC